MTGRNAGVHKHLIFSCCIWAGPETGPADNTALSCLQAAHAQDPHLAFVGSRQRDLPLDAGNAS